MARNTDTMSELESKEGVVRAVTSWHDCDHAVLIEAGTNVAPIREGKTVVGVQDFNSAPYTLFKLDD